METCLCVSLQSRINNPETLLLKRNNATTHIKARQIIDPRTLPDTPVAKPKVDDEANVNGAAALSVPCSTPSAALTSRAMRQTMRRMERREPLKLDLAQTPMRAGGAPTVPPRGTLYHSASSDSLLPRPPSHARISLDMKDEPSSRLQRKPHTPKRRRSLKLAGARQALRRISNTSRASKPKVPLESPLVSTPAHQGMGGFGAPDSSPCYIDHKTFELSMPTVLRATSVRVKDVLPQQQVSPIFALQRKSRSCPDFEAQTVLLAKHSLAELDEQSWV
eukprot:m.131011 g.131011  ORF g.131011 m.131011 type:complete len:277 (+) comp16804_c0_seq2:224-1054(+)